MSTRTSWMQGTALERHDTADPNPNDNWGHPKLAAGSHLIYFSSLQVLTISFSRSLSSFDVASASCPVRELGGIMKTPEFDFLLFGRKFQILSKGCHESENLGCSKRNTTKKLQPAPIYNAQFTVEVVCKLPLNLISIILRWSMTSLSCMRDSPSTNKRNSHTRYPITFLCNLGIKQATLQNFSHRTRRASQITMLGRPFPAIFLPSPNTRNKYSSPNHLIMSQVWHFAVPIRVQVLTVFPMWFMFC